MLRSGPRDGTHIEKFLAVMDGHHTKNCMSGVGKEPPGILENFVLGLAGTHCWRAAMKESQSVIAYQPGCFPTATDLFL